MLKKLKLNGSMKTYKTFRTNNKKGVLFIIGDWNAKVGIQEIPGISRKSRDIWQGFRMGNTGTPMADSCQCMAKSTTIL